MHSGRQVATHDTSAAPCADDPQWREKMLDVQQVAAYLSVSTQLIYVLSREGRIPHYRIGSLLRYRRDEIDAWLIQHHRDSVTNGSKNNMKWR